VRRDLWKKYIPAFGVERAGDFAFLKALYEGEGRPCMSVLRCIVAEIDCIGSHPPTKTKLNLGCGGSAAEGWLNMDIEPREGVDVVWDLAKFPYPLDDNYFTEIYSHHVLEHLNPGELIRAFREMFRVLKPGGEMNHTVPSLLGALDCFNAGNHKQFYRTIYGGVPFGKPDIPENRHKWAWIAADMGKMVKKIGFELLSINEITGKIPVFDIKAKKPEGR
jgi:predicted SAM-dependent methyltransferase